MSEQFSTKETPHYFEDELTGTQAQLLKEIEELIERHNRSQGWHRNVPTEVTQQALLMAAEAENVDLKTIAAESILPEVLKRLNEANAIVTESVPSLDEQARASFQDETGSRRKRENRQAAQARVGGPGA